MPRKKQEEEHSGSHERWLITYSDLITLLMIFFVLMYTISNVNAKKFETVSASLSKALTGENNTGHIVGDSQGPAVVPGKGQPTPMEKAEKEIAEYVKKQGLQGQVKVFREERGLVVRIQETLLFARGSATLSPQAKAVIKKVGSFLVRLPNHVRIEGHTCNLPISTPVFPSNWELSTARATNVVQVLIREVGYTPKKLSAVGYSEYRPLVSNSTEPNRAQNRRVDIVVLNDKFDTVEPK